MLTYFPEPYPDEILYSVLARYHSRSFNDSYKVTMNELFSNSQVTATIDFQSHLKSLCNNMPLGSTHTADSLLNNNTLFPFYAAFLPLDRREKIKNMMFGDTGTGVHASIGILAGSFPKKDGLCFCSSCHIEDIRIHGEPYWHRIHQVPGVIICPLHKEILYEYKVDNNNRHEFIAMPLKVNLLDHQRITGEVSNKTYEHLVDLAVEAYSLLFRSALPDFYKSKELLLPRMQQLGYATVLGRVRQQKLQEQVTLVYGKELLNILGSGLERDFSWITFATRKQRRVIHPVRQIILIRFLFSSLDQMLKVYRQDKYQPFGTSPWPCLNKSVDHYKEAVIEQCDIILCTDTRKPVGTFYCNCGFIYSRRGPDQQESDRYKIGRIKQFGTKWFEVLEQLVKDGSNSYRAIARYLNVDTNTVIKYKNLILSNWTYTEEKQERISVNKADIKPPTDKPKQRRNQFSHKRVDWEMRDLEISYLIEEKCKELLVETISKPIHITLTAVGRRIGKLSLIEKNKDKLPVTLSVFKQYEETLEDFQIRRVHWAASRMIEQNEELKKWPLLRKAGLKSNCGERVLVEVSKYVFQYDVKYSLLELEGQRWLH